MIIEVTEMYNKWNKGNSFVLNNIPNVHTVEDVVEEDISDFYIHETKQMEETK